MTEILEQYDASPHRQEAVFFYGKSPELGNIGSRIFKVTEEFFELHKFKPKGEAFVVAQCQLVGSELISAEDKIAGAGPIITLTHNGRNIHTEQSVWKIAIAELSGVDVLEIVTHGGYYAVRKRYNQQGRQVDISQLTNVDTIWPIAEACLDTEDARQRMNRMGYKQASDAISI